MNASAVLIAGPTASGKSAAALALAERIGGALINTDSMQVYREIRVLTARPDAVALARAPHHLYGHVGVHDIYSAARYLCDAQHTTGEVGALGQVPVFVGGTGLYFSALTEGLAEIPPVPEGVRAATRARQQHEGTRALHSALAERDPLTAARLRPTDTQRVLRAYEVMEGTGRPLAEWQQSRGAAPLAGFRIARFVLSPPRTELHRRIAARFETMLKTGAVEEAAALRGLDPALPASRILGLRELWRMLDGSATRAETAAAATAATRQYAKRQLTWFRHRMADWIWIEEQDVDVIISRMLASLPR